jgi:DNA-binding NtrC family response regulator
MNDAETLVYVVDDDPSAREGVAGLLRSAGLRAKTFASGEEFLASPPPQMPSCLVLDVNLPGVSGLDLQQELAKEDVHVPIIFLTGHGDIPMTVRAVKAGAMNFLTKPFDDEDLLNAIQDGITSFEEGRMQDRLVRENLYLDEQIRSEMGFEQIIGNCAAINEVLHLVETVAPTDSTVLLLGETGTGKELIARAIHERSRRKDRTFVKLNCAAIPTGLLESELFGHEKGAFTGAISQKVGRMELADQGTLFLDEVGDIPTEIQPKLLRALQEREFERLGSTHTRKVNIRLVAATNRDLEKMVATREFRPDLFYRLNVFPIRIPALRERREDIPLLAKFFVQRIAQKMEKRIDSIPAAVIKGLTAWDWPGNIRELENFIERAVILTRGKTLDAPLSELYNVRPDEPECAVAPRADEEIARIVKETVSSLSGKSDMDEYLRKQRDEIIRGLTECKGRIGGPNGVAARMGIHRTTLISRIRRLGINPYQYA